MQPPQPAGQPPGPVGTAGQGSGPIPGDPQAAAIGVGTAAVPVGPADGAAAADPPPAPASRSAPSSFDQRVYDAVACIPAGQLATYGQIAELIGAWGCARQVGWALRRLPLPSPVPWHRVVNAAGRITMTPSREGSDWMQRQLLLAEGIPVDAAGRLPLARCRWLPPWPGAVAAAPQNAGVTASLPRLPGPGA